MSDQNNFLKTAGANRVYCPLYIDEEKHYTVYIELWKSKIVRLNHSKQ